MTTLPAPARWRRYRGAPQTGQVIATHDAVPDGGTLSVLFTQNGREFPLLLVRRGPGLAVFINICPHADLPLTYRSERVLSADGLRLMCSNHAAEFDAMSGEGLGGLAANCRLDQVPVSVDAEGQIVVRDDPLTGR